MWQPPTNKIWFAKSEFLELVCPTVPTPELSIIPCVLSDLGQVMCDVDHVYATMSHPPIWQSMPRSNRNWHRITVLCRCFRETLCCQLGLGDWLASQSPNQVDSTEVANSRWQAAKIWLIHGQVPRAVLAFHAKQYGFWMVLCKNCWASCPTRQ